MRMLLLHRACDAAFAYRQFSHTRYFLINFATAVFTPAVLKLCFCCSIIVFCKHLLVLSKFIVSAFHPKPFPSLIFLLIAPVESLFKFFLPIQLLSLLFITSPPFQAEYKWKSKNTMIFRSAKQIWHISALFFPLQVWIPFQPSQNGLSVSSSKKTSPLVLITLIWSAATLNIFQRSAALQKRSHSLCRTLSCRATEVPLTLSFPRCFEYLFLILSFKPHCVSQGSPGKFSPPRIFAGFHFN